MRDWFCSEFACFWPRSALCTWSGSKASSTMTRSTLQYLPSPLQPSLPHHAGEAGGIKHISIKTVQVIFNNNCCFVVSFPLAALTLHYGQYGPSSHHSSSLLSLWVW